MQHGLDIFALIYEVLFFLGQANLNLNVFQVWRIALRPLIL